MAFLLQLSAQLRARLSYAMIKVQNGWEQKPIHEVEHLASQSPYLSPSGRVALRQCDSPRSQSTQAIPSPGDTRLIKPWL